MHLDCHIIVVLSILQCGCICCSVDSVASLAAACAALKSQLSEPVKFKPFYTWVFDFFRGKQKGLSTELAVAAVELILPESSFPMKSEWTDFLKVAPL